MESVRRDVIVMLAGAEARGELAESVIGADYKAFCEEIRESVRMKTESEKTKDDALRMFCALPFCGIVFRRLHIAAAFFGDGRGLMRGFWGRQHFCAQARGLYTVDLKGKEMAKRVSGAVCDCGGAAGGMVSADGGRAVMGYGDYAGK